MRNQKFSLLLEIAGSLQLFVYNISQQSRRISLALNLPQQLMNLFQRQRQFFQCSSPPVKELTDAKPYNNFAKRQERGKMQESDTLTVYTIRR